MALGLAAAAALPAQVAPPTDEEIKEFRSALEEYLSGNLPALVEHLRKIEPGAMDNPEAPGAPSWSAEPVHGTRIVTESVPDPNGGPPVLVTRTETFVEKTAAEVTSIWRRQAEQELRRIAQEAPAGTATEQAATVVEEGNLDQFEDERMDEYEDEIDEFAEDLDE